MKPPNIEIDKRTMFWMSALTLFGFSGLGWLVISLFSDESFRAILAQGQSIFIQLIVGLGYGLFAAAVGLIIVRIPYFSKISNFFKGVFKDTEFNMHDVVFYSFCAGVGEEIFFRAALQPFIGIWPTAILFVLLHGYVNFRNWPMTIYGFFLIAISAGFGYLFEYFGIWASATAHFAYDVVMFSFLIFFKEKRTD